MSNMVWLTIALLVTTLRLSASTYFIPQDFEQIQAGIDAAVDFDTLLVSPETYTEDLDFHGKNLRVIGLGGQCQCVLIGRVYFQSGEPSGCLFQNFTIVKRDGISWATWALYIDNYSSPTINNCLFLEFNWSVYTRLSAPTVSDCVFLSEPDLHSDLILSIRRSSVVFHRNVILNSISALCLFEAASATDSVVSEITDCMIADCRSYNNEVYHSVFSSNGSARLRVRNCIFVNNDIPLFQTNVPNDVACCISYNNGWDDAGPLDGLFQTRDPQVCQADSITFHLNALSPSLPENRPPDACGVIGPLAVGCDRPVPTLSAPWPPPDADPWPEVYGTVGATLTCETGIEAASLVLRIDANSDGDYLDGGGEDWTPVSGYSDAPEIVLRTPVRFPRSGSYHWEVKGRDLVSGWWVYSGSENLPGISDDWIVTINRLPRTWHLPQDVADLFAARDSLQDGDTLRLAPGTWAGGVDFGPWNVAIVGEGAPEEVIIQAPTGSQPVLHVAGSPVPGSCWLQNLTLQGGSGDVTADSTVLFARNCRLPEGGLISQALFSLQLDRGLLDARQCQARGGFYALHGLVLYECERVGDLVIDNSNLRPSAEAEEERLERISPVAWVARCRFEDNRGFAFGEMSVWGTFHALHLPNNTEGLVSQCVFVRNISEASSDDFTSEAGCAALAAGGADVQECLFVDNGVGAFGESDVSRAFAPVACVVGEFSGNTVVDNWTADTIGGDSPLVYAEHVLGNLFVGNVGSQPSCQASACNESWQNAGEYGAPWTAGLCGMNEGGQFAADPLFTDPANGDYRLLPGSPAWTPNHQDTAPGCGLMGAYGLSAPQLGPVEILGLQLLNNPLRTRLDLRCDGQGQTLHVYGAEDADGSYLELTSLAATDSLLSVDLPLGSLMPESRFYRVTQDEPGTVSLGSWRWSLPAGQRALPEPPLVTELDRLRRAGLPWKPEIR